MTVQFSVLIETGPSIGPSVINDAASSSSTWFSQPVATIFAALLVSIGAWGGIWMTERSRRTTAEAAADTDRREREAARQERYTTLAEHLASESSTMRLSGIYGLSALADEWHETKKHTQRDACIEILCAYLRANRHGDGEEEVREAAVNVIRQHTKFGAKNKWPGVLIRLRGVKLNGADLDGCDLSYADFSNSVLRSCNFMKTNFCEAKFFEAKLQGGFCLGAKFHGAELWRASFFRVIVSMADFRGAALSECAFGLSSLHGTKFAKANFHDPMGQGISLIRVVQDEGDNAHVESAEWDENTTWPEGFDPLEEVLHSAALLGLDPPPGLSAPRLA